MSASFAVANAMPDGDKKLRQMKKGNPSKYREMMMGIGSKGKHQRISGDSIRLAAEVVAEDVASRERALECKRQVLYLTKEECIQHKIQKNGWSRRKARRFWAKQRKNPDADWDVEDGEDVLGVKTPRAVGRAGAAASLATPPPPAVAGPVEALAEVPDVKVSGVLDRCEGDDAIAAGRKGEKGKTKTLGGG